MIYSCLFEICGLMRRRPGERIPEGEMKRKPFCLVGTCKNFPFIKNTIETVPSKRLRFKSNTIHP
jgi:hypothetical protein